MPAAPDHQPNSASATKGLPARLAAPPRRTWTRYYLALSLLFGGAAISVIGSFIVGLLASYIQKEPELFSGRPMPQLAQWCLNQPARILLMGLPPAVIAIMLFMGRPRSGIGRWMLFALGMACLVMTLGLVIYCFVNVMRPLYDPPQ